MRVQKFLLLILVLCAGRAGAQKIAVANVDGLVYALPETGKIDSLLKSFQQDTIGGEYMRLSGEYSRRDSILKITTKQTTKDSIQTALNSLAETLQNWQQIAEQARQNKQNELLFPLYQKVRNAISAYAKEKGYAYVLHKRATVISRNTDDITLAVAQRLGIKKVNQ